MSASNPPSLGKYEIRGTLGKGAMGIVYDGWDPVIDRRVAIKTVRLPDANDEEAIEGLARFKREAQAAGRLTHPNIVGVFDYGETADVAYIVMEFVEGKSLKEVLGTNERMTAARAIRLMEDVLAGLSYSHGRGVVHRDIKPANIMMAGERAKIADFGIARIEASSMTQAGTVLGTPAYMSPEQFMGQVVDRRTDIYSCGVMFYQLLAGERPFEGSMTAIMHKALTTTPPRPSELAVTSPASLDAVVAKAMARRPEDRFDTADAFAAALRAHADVPDDPFASDETMVAAPRAAAAARPQPVAAPIAAAPPPAKRSKLPLFAGAGVGVVGIAAAIWFLLPGPPPTVLPTRQVTLAEPPATATPQAITPSTAAAPATTAPAATKPASLPPTEQASVPAAQPAAEATAAPSQQLASADVPPPVATSHRDSAGLPPSTLVSPAMPPPTAVSSQAEQSAPSTASPFVIAPNSPQPAAVGVPSASVATSAEPLAVTAAVQPTAEPARVANLATSEAPAAVTATLPPAHTDGVAASSSPAAAAQPSTPPQHLAALVQPVVPPQATAPLRTAAAIQAALSVTVPSTACSLVRTATTGGGDVTVSGVSGAEAALREAVAAAEPVNVAWNVQKFDGPYCPALDVLRAASDASHARAGLDLAQAGGAAPLTDNAVIALRAIMPGFGGYLHVAYLQHDSTVSPLVPGPGYPSQTYAARSEITLGTERPDFPGWHVGPPFGTDMIVAIASTAPLFAQPLPDSQPLPAYLAALKSAMADLRRHGGSLAAAAVVLDTRPAP